MFIVNRTSVSLVENINFYWLCCGGVFVGDIKGLSDRLLSCKRNFINLIQSMLMEFTKKKTKMLRRERGEEEEEKDKEEYKKKKKKRASLCVCVCLYSLLMSGFFLNKFG